MSITTTTTTVAGMDGSIKTTTTTVSGVSVQSSSTANNDPAFEVPYVIKESAIGGIGIFATEFIPKGALLWRYAPGETVKLYETEAKLRARVAEIKDPKEVKEFLEHVYTFDGTVIEIVGDGKMWNHSKVNANTGSSPFTGEEDSSYAIKDIQPGEEFLVAHEYGAFTCVDCGEEFD
eukprot:gene7742-22332_t